MATVTDSQGARMARGGGAWPALVLVLGLAVRGSTPEPVDAGAECPVSPANRYKYAFVAANYTAIGAVLGVDDVLIAASFAARMGEQPFAAQLIE